MTVGSKEFHDIMQEFEKQYKHLRIDREAKDDWKEGRIYQSGGTNDAFKIFISGYSLGRCIYLHKED